MQREYPVLADYPQYILAAISLLGIDLPSNKVYKKAYSVSDGNRSFGKQ